MPTTVNGIGTHYYGKKDLSTRTAPCRWCNRVGALESYNTRLWFVVVFIPIIPLGRKRIIDSCPSCRRHMVADADKYEQARQLQISGSLDRFRREGSIESSLEAHAQLLAFHEHAQATDLRREILGRFPKDARLRAALANHMQQVSSYEEMARLNDEALALEPDLPEARAGVAVWKMAHGELDEARRLLDYLEEPGAGHHYDLAPLYSLAHNFQNAGRHHETLELAAVLIREAPHLCQRHDFRSMVKKSERATHTLESLVPPRQHSLRGLFRAENSPYSKEQRALALGAAAFLLAGIGLFASNEYIRRHRTIRVANACGTPVQIRVDDATPVMIADDGKISVSEGKHRVRVSGPVEETHDVDITSGYFERWTSSPLWILNPGGEAVLYSRTVVYAANPPPSEQVLFVGQPFVALPHVDYPFEDPPASIQVKGRNNQVTKIVVQRLYNQDNDAFLRGTNTNRAAALNFAENRLRHHADTDLLNSYVSETIQRDRKRAREFLKTGLARKPVSVPWHRYYQTFGDRDGQEQAIIAEYDAMLAKDPANPALIYLRGRVDPDVQRRLEFFRRSATADPKFPWPFMALGMNALNVGRWEDALRDLQKAHELKLDDPQLARAIHTARIALGQAEAMVTEYRAALTSNPSDLRVAVELFDVLAASGHPEGIEPERLNWEARLPGDARGPISAMVKPFALYQAGRPDEAAQATQAIPPPTSFFLRADCLAAAGHAVDAVAIPALGKPESPWPLVSIALGLALEGKPDDAASWREKACVELDGAGTDERKIAAFIRAAAPPFLGDIDHVFLKTGEKALLLALLAERFPEKRAEYHEAAARYNVIRLPPYLLVRHALEKEPSAKP